MFILSLPTALRISVFGADLLIMDDYLARKYAEYLDFKITGTSGVILSAKEKGFIEKVKPCLDQLIDNWIYIGKQVYDNVIMLAGEEC